MGVSFIGGAVGCPAGVGDTYGAAAVVSGSLLLRIDDFADSLLYVQVSVFRNECDSSRVVAPVLQPVEAFDENGICLTASCITDYSAHN